MDPSPRSLILDLLSTVGRASAPVRALLEAGELFDIGGNRLRVALARLCADGLVERDSRGRYRLGRAARAVNEEIRAWPHLEERLRPWQSRWIAVQRSRLGRPARAAARRNRDRALRLLGFRPFGPGLEIRPDNLAGGVAGVRRRLAALGLECPGLVFGAGELDEAADAAARGLWDADAIVAGYAAGRASLERSAERLHSLPRAQAMAESFRRGGAAIRQLVGDPLLPEAIVPGAERRALLAAAQRYDRLGREAWAGWLGEDAPEAGAHPVGVREASPGALGIAGGA